MSTEQIIDLDFQTESGNKKEVTTVDSSRFLLLYILSFGLYGIWWMYKAWRFFKEKDSLDIMPVPRAIFSIFFVYSLFERIIDYADENNADVKPYSSGLLTTGFIVLNMLSRLPDPYWLIAFCAGLCFLQPINVFNMAITNSDKYRHRKNTGMSPGQIVIVIVGSLWWLLVLIGLFMPVEEGY